MQRGSYTMTSTYHIITLDTPVPGGKSFPIISSRMASATGKRSEAITPTLAGLVDGCYTTLVLQRYSTDDGNVTVEWQVVSGDIFTVQSGIAYPMLSTSVTINEVNTGETFVLAYTRQGSADVVNDTYYRVRVELISSTSVRFTRNTSGRDIPTVYYVVSMEGATVHQFTGTFSNVSEVNVTVPPVDLGKTFLCQSFDSNRSSYALDYVVSARFIDATTVALKTNSTITGTVAGFTVSHPKINVMSGFKTMDAVFSAEDNVSVDDTMSFSLANVGGKINGYANTPGVSNVSHSLSSSKLTFARLHVLHTAEIAWFVVEWKAVIPPANLRPNDAAAMPDEQSIFTWTKDATMTATAYEIQYRAIVEPEGEWTSTGKVESHLQRHVFPADTFGVGNEFEWRVRHWDNESVDPSDWAEATFDTIRPVIQNPVPIPDSRTRVQITTFGGRLKSPYGRDIQLTILISANASFTDPTTYTLPAVESGELAVIEHGLQEGGTWYVRLTATDTEEFQTVLAYSFFAGEYKQFINLPSIQQEPQQATHVTVRVRDSATEYTAVVDPAPPPDRKVEWLFYIQSGTVATCQAVAEAYLAKLGRPQVKVSGRIPLAVTLWLRRKIRVVIPPAGIDEEMILRKKTHKIDKSDKATYVDLGDIMVSDDELITRILERVKTK